jgi:hypothetical protein
MLYKTLAIILLLVTITLSAQNTDTREYGFKFLQIPVNPVASGLGGTGIYASNYSGAFTLNPAANLMDERFSLSLQHCIWLVDTSCSQIVYSNGNRNKHFGLVTRILDYGQLEKRDDTGALIGNYNPLDANIMVNFAYRVMPDHMLGVNAGLLYEKIDTASSYGLSSDFGYLFLPPITNTTFFASLRNVGVTSKMENESIKLPVTFETGLSYTLPKEGYSVSGQFAINKARGSDLRYTVAAELALWQTLMLRAGYKGNYDEEGLTAGLGINWHNVGIDYGWTSFSERLNDTHSFGVTYNF